MTILRKSDILNGKNQTEEVYIPLFDDEITLRPLTDGEYNDSQVIRNKLGKQRMKMELDQDPEKIKEDVKKQFKGKEMNLEIDTALIEAQKFKADCKVAAYGLSIDEKWTENDVKNLRPLGVVKEIADAVLRISKVEEGTEKLNKDVESFRE